MAETQWQLRWRAEARVLGELGRAVLPVEIPTVQVRLPAALADTAAAAWERDDAEGDLGPETVEQRLYRHRAGGLALIGLAVIERGRREGDEVVVDLGADLVALAVDAADDLPA